MSENKAEKLPPLPPVPRRFVRLAFDFFVGLAIGLAPFLGTKDVPGFRALISIMPFQTTQQLITQSAFLMGIIVVAIQFYSQERISRSLLKRLFGIALIAMLVGFLFFYHLRNEYTVDVERGSDERVTVLISSKARKQCACKDADQNPEQCIQKLSFSAPAIASCWDRREIRRRGGLLGLSYLILTGGVGVLIGFLILQEKILEERKKQTLKRQEAQKKDRVKAIPGASKTQKAKAAPAPQPEEPTPPE